MEQFPQNPLNSSQALENPYFFEKRKDRNLDSYVKKRSLVKVKKERFDDETDGAYKARMEGVLQGLLDEEKKDSLFLKAFNNLHEYHRTGKKDGRKLFPVIKLQNKITSAIAELPEAARFDCIRRIRLKLRSTFEATHIPEKIQEEIMTTFDGVKSVCDYMEKRKKESGDNVQFYTESFLDWSAGIDLLEFEKTEDSRYILKLVQSKSSNPSSEDLAKNLEKHRSWALGDVMGTHQLLDEFADVLQAEAESNHQENLREDLADSISDAAQLALRLAARKKGEESNPDVESALGDESRLSLLAFALHFQEDKTQEEIHMLLNGGDENVGSTMVNGYPISDIYSAYVVEGADFEPPKRIYTARNDDSRELFVGVEKSL